MQRIWIIGSTGSGKTTLGKHIAQKLNIAAVDLDELHWLPDWKTVSPEQMLESIDAATAKDSWAVSGNYAKTQEYLARADTLIWLDYSFVTILSQLLKRTFRRVYLQEKCCNGNVETWRGTFSRESIILWLFRTYSKRKQNARQIIAAPQNSHLKVLHFKKPIETARWLKSLHNERGHLL